MTWRGGRTLLSVLLLGFFTSVAGCATPGAIRKEVPANGVQLRYDLTPGEAYVGHIQADDTSANVAYGSSRSVAFSVDLLVGEAEGGGHRMLAVVHDVTAGKALPGMPVRTRASTTPSVKGLEGVKLRFVLRDDGEVDGLYGGSETPLSRDADGVLKQVKAALRASFVQVPRTPVHEGGRRRRWKTEDGKAQRKWAVRITEMFRDASSGEEMVRVRWSRRIHDQVLADPITERVQHDEAKALFSRDGYLRRLDLERETRFSFASVSLELHAEWSKAPASGRRTGGRG